MITRHELPDPLMPRQVLFGNPVGAAPRLSPDGAWLAHLRPTRDATNEALNISVGVAGDDPHLARQVTFCDLSVLHYVWAYDGRHLLYLRDDSGREKWHVHAVDVVTGASRDLTPFRDVAARIERLSPASPDRAVLAINDRNPGVHDLYDVDIGSGTLHLVEVNPGFADYVVDGNLQPVLARQLQPNGGSTYLRRAADGTWIPFIDVPFVDMFTTFVLGFDSDGENVFLSDSRDRDTAALTRMPLSGGERTVIAEDPHADVSSAMFHPLTDALQAVLVKGSRTTWRIFDSDTAVAYADLRAVDPTPTSAAPADKAPASDLFIASRTADDSKWVAAFVCDNRPTSFHLYDRADRSTRFLFTTHDGMDGSRLAHSHSVSIAARDGLQLPSYLQLPPWTDPDATGKPHQPLPLVILVHGGPWSRDSWGFNPSAQWLNNRGYATLSVNFRGSAGFGKHFLNAGNQQWGLSMQDDLLDARHWAVDSGVARADQVALMGSSYGGYAALTGLSRDGDAYACAVDLFGPSNLLSFLDSAPPVWQPLADLFTTRIGDHRSEAGRTLLTEHSPLTHVDQIRNPLLVVHGGQDPRIPRAESDRIVEALNARGSPVVYLLFPDEGHGILRPVNAQAFSAIAETFLARCLGGRAEAIGDLLEISSAEILAGSDWLMSG